MGKKERLYLKQSAVLGVNCCVVGKMESRGTMNSWVSGTRFSIKNSLPS